jgi:hypothetical protein
MPPRLIMTVVARIHVHPPLPHIGDGEVVVQQGDAHYLIRLHVADAEAVFVEPVLHMLQGEVLASLEVLQAVQPPPEHEGRHLRARAQDLPSLLDGVTPLLVFHGGILS